MLRQVAQRLAQTTYRAAAQRHPTLHSQTGCCTSEAVAHVSYVNSLSRVCKPHGCSRVSLVRGHTTTAASEAAVAGDVAGESRPSTSTLRTLFVHSAVPFVAFGFVDNSVLIHAGDAIDNTFGVYLAMPTLAAAAMGQVFSDTTGVLFGSTIEALATRLGLPVPDLSPAQRRMKVTKLVGTAGAVVGVVTGCCLGMLNLLLIDLGASERQRREAELHTIFQTIMAQGHEVTECERSSLFVVDKEKQELWSVTSKYDPHMIRLPVGTGIAGYVAKTGESVMSSKVYEDPRFFSDVDKETHYVTRNIICGPVKNSAGEVVAVVEFVNKLKGEFTETDMKLLRMLCSHVAVFISSVSRE